MTVDYNQIIKNNNKHVHEEFRNPSIKGEEAVCPG